MKVLYSAIDQTVPGAHGGSVHVRSVAEGLSALGHEVHVLASPGDGGRFPSGSVHWWAMPPPLGNRRLRLLRAGAVLRRARAIRPDVVIERYYNFGGEGLLAARKVGALAVLEVNAPIVDYPGSAKQWLDRATIVQPLRRWREWQCRVAHLIVTPSTRIIPDTCSRLARASDRVGRRYRLVSARGCWPCPVHTKGGGNDRGVCGGFPRMAWRHWSRRCYASAAWQR